MTESTRKPISEQQWQIIDHGEAVFLADEYGEPICKMLRPDHGSNLFVAGLILGFKMRRP